jgi:branched-chain amino acid transport system ATP-binding protein
VSLLSVRNLEVHYDRLRAVEEVSFNVAEGEIVALVGPNGAGKSTILMTIAGALKPSRGEITFDGRVVTGQQPEQAVQRGISLMPEGRRIFGSLTVEENLRVGAIGRPKGKAVEADFEARLDQFPILRTYRHQKASRLSGGEQQQVAIARALMSRPKLLLVDEASLGLSPIVVELVFEILSQLRDEGRGIVLVEHEAERVLSIADRVYAIVEGRSHDLGVRGEADVADLELVYLGARPLAPTADGLGDA